MGELTAFRPRYSAPAKRRPVLVEVPRHRIVGQRVEYQVVVSAALVDVDAAIEYLHRDDEVPANRGWHREAIRVLREHRTQLTNLLASLKAECGELDGLCDDECRQPGHGAAA